MILTTGMSSALLQLLEMEGVPIDAIEVGPWFTVEEIRQYQKQLPSVVYICHHHQLNKLSIGL